MAKRTRQRFGVKKCLKLFSSVRTKFKQSFVPTQQRVGEGRWLSNHPSWLNLNGKSRSITSFMYRWSGTLAFVKTVKLDGSLKRALDSKTLNVMVCKNKYQMPNIHKPFRQSRSNNHFWKTQLSAVHRKRLEICLLTTPTQSRFGCSK